MDKYLAVAIGGAAGAVARFWIGMVVGEKFPSRFPYGTLIINVTGSFIIGFFLTLVTERIDIHPNWRYAFAVGFVGAYTTFSTFEWETFKLIETGDAFNGLMNIAISVILGFLAVWGGIALARKVDVRMLHLDKGRIVTIVDTAEDHLTVTSELEAVVEGAEEHKSHRS
jgi:crcB protein